jgi:hypothetical protein
LTPLSSCCWRLIRSRFRTSKRFISLLFLFGMGLEVSKTP